MYQLEKRTGLLEGICHQFLGSKPNDKQSKSKRFMQQLDMGM